MVVLGITFREPIFLYRIIKDNKFSLTGKTTSIAIGLGDDGDEDKAL
jgi:hypothetical protein